MRKVKTSYDDTAKTLFIHCPDRPFVKDGRFFMFVKRYKASVDDLTVKVDCNNFKLSEVYSYLQNTASKLNAEIDIDDFAGNELKRIRNDNNEFKAFTQMALDVWNGSFVPTDLSNFEEILFNRVHRKLSKYQFLSAMHLAFSQNACNFSVPGAGKTTIVYSAFSFLNALENTNPKHIDRMFVIGPLASYYAWKFEFEKCFNRQPRTYRILGGVGRQEIASVLRGQNSNHLGLDLIHSSFQSASNYEEEIISYLSDGRYSTMLVVDEAHNIKRDDGVWSNSCLNLARYAKSRVILTGTTAPNGYEDLYNLFKFLYPDKNIIGFKKSNLVAMTQGEMSSSNLISAISPFFTRITKAHLNLPPIQINRVELDLVGAERNIYNNLEDALVSGIDVGSIDATEGLKAKIIRLRQAASNHELLIKPIEGVLSNCDSDEYRNLIEQIRLMPFSESSKAKSLIDISSRLVCENKKVLIWSYFIGTIDSIVNLLRSQLTCKVSQITGATPSDGNAAQSESYDEQAELTREQIIKDFNESDEVQILVANPQALGESVSLHYSCHDAIYFDRDFNCGRFIQSKDRIHRYGLPDDVITNYYYLMSRSTIDFVIDSRLQMKEDRMNSIVEKEEIPLFRGIDGDDLSFDDLKQILRYYDERKFK